jgi:uncharacterized protein YcgL (UPF0745 family)
MYLTSADKTAILRPQREKETMSNTHPSSLNVSSYRHNRKENTYLFVVQTVKWDELPEALQQQFSTAAKVIDFEMTPTRKLARADSQQVWQALTTQGYYLQMPPADPYALQAQEDAFISKTEASTPA